MKLTVIRHLEPIPWLPGCNDISRELMHISQDVIATLRHSLYPVYDYGFYSPYKRCVQTAKTVEDFALLWHESTDLRESAYPPQQERLGRKLLVREESVFDTKDRVSQFLTNLRSVRPSAALVITHGDVVNAFRWCLEGLTLREYSALFNTPDNFVGFGSALNYDLAEGIVTKKDGCTGETVFKKEFRPPTNNSLFAHVQNIGD